MYLFMPTQKPEEDSWVLECLPLVPSIFPFFNCVYVCECVIYAGAQEA